MVAKKGKARSGLKKNESDVVVEVTPNPKVKGNRKGVKAAHPGNRLLYRTAYIVMHMACDDGSNNLSVIPGGFIDHWKMESYIKWMHDKLVNEMTAWMTSVTKFVSECQGSTGGMFKEEQHDYIKRAIKVISSFVKKMPTITTVIHSMNENAIAKALGIKNNTTVIQLISFFCRSSFFKVKFVPGARDGTYDLRTIFGCNEDWGFGKIKK